MTQQPLRILLVGGDTSIWVGLSTTLGQHAPQIYVPREIDPAALYEASEKIDVVVVVMSPVERDPCEPVRILRDAGLARKTLVLGPGEDRRTAAEAVSLGVSGYLPKGSTPEALADAILRVGRGSVVLEGVAADIVHAGGGGERPATNLHMAAARALAAALEMKDTYTGGHAERVTALAIRLTRAADLEDALPSEDLEAAFLLHDVGKIGIPESILNKPGGLTDTERRVLNTHPILGERIIAPLGFAPCVRQVVRHHHERWDGLGYPDGLKGNEIPAAARIFSIADVIDAMTSMRPYRKPVSFEAAVREVMQHAGTQFDPHLATLAEATFLDAPVELLDI